MTIPTEKIRNFLENLNIYDVDEYIVNDFFGNYSTNEIAEWLVNDLKSVATIGSDIENSQKLGRELGFCSSKYSFDEYVYAYHSLNNTNQEEQYSLFLFLVGYWDNASEATLDVIIKLAKETSGEIINEIESKWDKNLISIAIQAVVGGYINNKKLFQTHEIIELDKILTVFRSYVFRLKGDSSDHEFLSTMFSGVLTGVQTRSQGGHCPRTALYGTTTLDRGTFWILKLVG